MRPKSGRQVVNEETAAKPWRAASSTLHVSDRSAEARQRLAFLRNRPLAPVYDGVFPVAPALESNGEG